MAKYYIFMDFKERLLKIDAIWSKIQKLNQIFLEDESFSEDELALIKKYLKQIETIYNIDSVVMNTSPILDIPKEVFSPIKTEVAPAEIAKVHEQKIITTTEEVIDKVETKIDLINEVKIDEIIIPENKIENINSKPAEVEIRPNIVEENEDLSLNNMFTKKHTTDILSKLAKRTAENISLGDKFEFIAELFGNNPIEYATALAKIDEANSYQKAFDYLKSEFSHKFDWSKKEETAEKFLLIVESRFNSN